jgi:single-strand DNA-binding protein
VDEAGLMADLNVVCLSGRLTKDPELRQLPSGTSLCEMRLAVNERYKDSNGEWRDKPFYFNVTAWGRRGEVVAEYLSKGSPLMIRGRLQWREWDAQDGSKRQAVDVTADEVIFMPRNDGGDGRGRSSEPTRASGDGAGYGVPTSQPTGQPPRAPIPDDDDGIPF